MRNQTEENTPQYWAMKVKDLEIRYRLLANLEDSKPVFTSIHHAIKGGFYWVRSPEGAVYWRPIHEKELYLTNQKNRMKTKTTLILKNQNQVNTFHPNETGEVAFCKDSLRIFEDIFNLPSWDTLKLTVSQKTFKDSKKFKIEKSNFNPKIYLKPNLSFIITQRQLDFFAPDQDPATIHHVYIRLNLPITP